MAAGHPGQDPLLPRLGDCRHRRQHYQPPTKAGTVLWHHAFLPSDSSGSDRGTGHYPLVYDWNGDGKDEVMAGYFFLQSDGTQVWTTNTTSHPELTMHADCLATADVDGDPSNGYEIVVGGNVAAMFHWKDGSQIWEDTNTVEDQQMGIGEYRSDSPGLEVVLLDRIGPRDATGHDANVLLSSTDKLLWKETRTDYGWITVTENMNNWLGDGTDLILSYHRGGQTPATLYDGYDKVVASFPIVATWSTTFSTPIFAATARKKSSCTTKAESGFSPMATAIWMSHRTIPFRSSTTCTTSANTRDGSLLT